LVPLQSSSPDNAIISDLLGREVSVGEFDELQQLMFGSSDTATGSTYASVQDIQRWHDQGFLFCSPTQNNALAPAIDISYGLKQSKGGPCGILAAVQAEIFRELCFPTIEIRDNVQSQDLDSFLLRAIIRILERASSIHINLVIPVDLANDLSQSSIRIITCPSFSDALSVAAVKLLPHLQSPTGCVLFLMSLIFSR
jgi:hypothetical protein